MSVTTSTFEQVAELLWSGGIPVPPPVWPPGRPLPFTPADATMLDRLRLAVALDACAPRPPVSFGADGAALLVEEGPGLVATMVGALPIRGRPPVRGDDTTVGPDGAPGPIAERLAVRLSGGRPRRALVELVDAALVLLADHEMATSTFAARLAASVRADAHAVVSAGMGPVAGPLHGQASRAVRRMLDDAVATSPVAVARRSSIRRSPAPGIGHGLYPHGDPRAVELLGRLRSSGGPPRRLRLVEELLTELDRAGAGRANVDFALGALGHVWSMPVDAGEAIFTVARSVGWLAHGAEEWSRRPLRFRARARYVPARADGTA